MRAIVAVAVASTVLALVVLSTSWRDGQAEVELVDALAAKTSHLEAMSQKVKARLGGQVASDDLASSILTSARKKFEAHKKLAAKQALQDKQTVHKSSSPKSVDGIHLDAAARKKFKQLGAEKALMKKSKENAAAKIEQAIAHHKLTTRGIIAAVKAAEAHQIQELNEGLKEQTDDLIVAKIKQLQKGSHSSADQFVLNNALTKEERVQLHAKKHVAPVAPVAAATRATSSWKQSGTWGQPQQQKPAGSLQSQNGAIMHATGGSKGGNPEGMLSSYDQELLSKGPDALADEQPHYAAPQGAAMLSQVPQQSYGAAPQQYAAAPLQQQYGYSGEYARPYAQQPYAPTQQAYNNPAPYYAPMQQQAYEPAPQYAPMQQQAYVAPPPQIPQEGYAQQQPYAPPNIEQAPQPYAPAPYEGMIPPPQAYSPAVVPGVGEVPAAGAVGPEGYPVAPQPEYAPPQYPPEYSAPPQQPQGEEPQAMPVQEPQAMPVQEPQGMFERPPQEEYAPQQQPQAVAPGEQEAPVEAPPMYPTPPVEAYPPQAPTMFDQPPREEYVPPVAQQQQQQQAEPAPEEGQMGEAPVQQMAQQSPNQGVEGGYGESAAVLSNGGRGGDSGGGTLWKLFTAPSGSGSGGSPNAQMMSPPVSDASPLSQSGDGLSMGGMQSTSSGEDTSSLSDGGGSDAGDGGDGGGAVPDPRAILGNKVSTSSAKKLSPSAKAQLAAQMQALRQSIMGDFKSTTQMGQQAGYLPPPPVG